MNRRQFLSTAAVSAIAGCSANEGGDTISPAGTETQSPTSSATPTPTHTATPTRTPEPSPEVGLVNLISRWEEFGDVAEHEMTGAGAGGFILIGFRYSIQIHDGVHHALQQVRLFDDDGTRVAMDSFEDRQLVEGSGRSEWENRLSFETTGLDLGTYTAEVLVQDMVNNKVSNRQETTFELVPPLGPNEAEIPEVDAPDTVQIGDPYSFIATVENVGGRDSSVVSTLSSKYESQDTWVVSDGKIFQVPLAEGETNTWPSSEVTYNAPGTVQIRVDAINELWTVNVTES